jgi:hypothetical protein
MLVAASARRSLNFRIESNLFPLRLQPALHRSSLERELTGSHAKRPASSRVHGWCRL